MLLNQLPSYTDCGPPTAAAGSRAQVSDPTRRADERGPSRGQGALRQHLPQRGCRSWAATGQRKIGRPYVLGLSGRSLGFRNLGGGHADDAERRLFESTAHAWSGTFVVGRRRSISRDSSAQRQMPPPVRAYAWKHFTHASRCCSRPRGQPHHRAAVSRNFGFRRKRLKGGRPENWRLREPRKRSKSL